MTDKELEEKWEKEAVHWECDITLINTVKFDSEEEMQQFNRLVKEIK